MVKSALFWSELDNFPNLQHQERTLESEVLTLAEVAAYLKVNEKTIYRMVQAGKIPAFKVAGSWRFKSDELHSWIESKKNTAPQAREQACEDNS